MKRLGMRIATPGLDRLTAEIKAQFFEGVTDLGFRMPYPGAGGHVLLRPTARYLTGPPGLSVATIDILICKLYAVDDIPDASSHEEVREMELQSAAHNAGISDDTARELLALMGDVKAAIRKLVVAQLNAYTDVEVGAVLVDLFHINYDEFDSGDPANALDYNCDDYFPQGETPRDTLLQLTQGIVIARLVKSAGRQLMLAWTKAQEADEVAWMEARQGDD
jgi:hypothetical protein